MSSPASSNSGAVTLPWLVALLAASFAIGVGLPESLKLHLTSSFPLGHYFLQVLHSSHTMDWSSVSLPAQAQLTLPASTVVLPVVQPPSVANATAVRHLVFVFGKLLLMSLDVCTSRYDFRRSP